MSSNLILKDEIVEKILIKNTCKRKGTKKKGIKSNRKKPKDDEI
jgi:hypothetical protein